jgi:hypothetical protein
VSAADSRGGANALGAPAALASGAVGTGLGIKTLGHAGQQRQVGGAVRGLGRCHQAAQLVRAAHPWSETPP